MEGSLTRRQRRAIRPILAKEHRDRQEGMVKRLWSPSIDREGRGMPENSKNCHLLSLLVTLGTP